MTRINLIEPTELTDQHLIAEYREIRLHTANLQRTLECKSGFVAAKVPKKFTLNAGHCYFFYNKGKYLHNRYNQLRDEMISRGFQPNHEFPRSAWPDNLYNDWTPSEVDKDVVRERIKVRIAQKPTFYRYRGKYLENI